MVWPLGSAATTTLCFVRAGARTAVFAMEPEGVSGKWVREA